MTREAAAEAPDLGEVVALLTEAGVTVGIAESLTGGAVTAALVSVPGASQCLRGGVVAYATDVKAAVLNVPRSLLEERGAVHPDVALAMAVGVRRLLSADYGVATTGVAGPDPQDGHSPGTFFVAVAGPWGTEVAAGPEVGPWTDRDEVRRSACDAALTLLVRRVRSDEIRRR